MSTYKGLLGRGWTWLGPTAVDYDGVIYYELRIKELPGYLVAGESRAEVIGEALPALRAFLDSFKEDGEPVPQPPPQSWFAHIPRSGMVRPRSAFHATANDASKEASGVSIELTDRITKTTVSI